MQNTDCYMFQMKKEKKTLGEHLPIVSTARDNLVRFIQYKQKVMS